MPYRNEVLVGLNYSPRPTEFVLSERDSVSTISATVIGEADTESCPIEGEDPPGL